ncbi:hypothetical protein D3C71_1759140 [compost metagenome]
MCRETSQSAVAADPDLQPVGIIDLVLRQFGGVDDDAQQHQRSVRYPTDVVRQTPGDRQSGGSFGRRKCTQPAENQEAGASR